MDRIEHISGADGQCKRRLLCLEIFSELTIPLFTQEITVRKCEPGPGDIQSPLNFWDIDCQLSEASKKDFSGLDEHHIRAFPSTTSPIKMSILFKVCATLLDNRRLGLHHSRKQLSFG